MTLLIYQPLRHTPSQTNPSWSSAWPWRPIRGHWQCGRCTRGACGRAGRHDLHTRVHSGTCRCIPRSAFRVADGHLSWSNRQSPSRHCGHSRTTSAGGSPCTRIRQPAPLRDLLPRRLYSHWCRWNSAISTDQLVSYNFKRSSYWTTGTR